MPGPPRKRRAERRRRNIYDVETETVDLAETTQMIVQIPIADPAWHSVARMWYDSLKHSGQAIFFEPSDWTTAYLIAESISRDLEEQVVGVTEAGEAIYAQIPMKGASLSAYLKAMTALMVTEGDRRRAKLEIDRANVATTGQPATTGGNVTSIAQGRTARFSREAQK